MADIFEVRAIAKNLPISPQKARLVVDTVRGKNADLALDSLRFLPNKAAEPVFKLIQSALANAEENYGLDMEDLYVHKIFVDDGRRLKRGRFGSRGRWKPLIKRQCHITVVLAEREDVG
ncbi:MAG: 50S ribosomal protein L22 [Ardenticatenaceae bacterium]|nr:50S ribosomal protein L22 [Ardenticatenaceae bacterium]